MYLNTNLERAATPSMAYKVLLPVASFVSTAWDIEDCREEDEGSTYLLLLSSVDGGT